jgi:hypothetical protein
MNFYQEVVQAQLQASHRELFTCKRCNHTWGHDYVEYHGKFCRVTPTYLQTPEEDARCPTCQSRLVKHGEVKGKLANKPCDERCMEAATLVCTCSCGGANHGKHLVEVV